jgi:hypothetical protein
MAAKKTEKTEAKVEVEAPRAARVPVKRAAKPKMVHEVVHVGNRIYLRGTDVRLRDLPREQWALHGIKGIEGEAGKPCAEEVVVTFKSPRAAASFFSAAFNAEDEAEEHIITGGKADWYGESMEQAAQALANR